MLEGNESANKAARLSAKLDQTLQPLDFSSIQAGIKRCVTRTWRRSIRHDRLSQAECKPPNQKEKNLARCDRITFSQLRAGGHCPMLRSYRYRIRIDDSDKCKRGQIYDLQHAFLECPMIQTKRSEILGPNLNMELLCTN